MAKTWHYHSWECPHCKYKAVVACNLTNCNRESKVSTKPFVRASYVALLTYCEGCGEEYYRDSGNHQPIEKEAHNDTLPVQFPRGRGVLFKNPQ